MAADTTQYQEKQNVRKSSVNVPTTNRLVLATKRNGADTTEGKVANVSPPYCLNYLAIGGTIR